MEVLDSNDSKKSDGKYDPGWNDPPTFSYNSQITPGKPRVSLNKRVAFPLSTNITNAGATNPPHQLPPVLPNIPPMVPQNPSLISSESNQIPLVPNILNPSILIPSLTETKAPYQKIEDCDFNEVSSILNQILEENQELGNKIEDIKRRIEIMKNMWLEGGLVHEVQVSMLKLVQALQNGDMKTADEIHKSLIVDHVGSVRSWMVAVKQLILHCTAKQELLNIEKDS